jgi:hypothetical protein
MGAYCRPLSGTVSVQLSRYTALVTVWHCECTSI